MAYVNPSRVPQSAKRTMGKRFSFPGLSFVCCADTPTEEVDVGHYSIANVLLCVELYRLTRSPDKRFWVRAVFDAETGHKLWRPSAQVRGQLFDVSGQPAVVVLSLQKTEAGEIVDIMPLSDLATRKQLDLADQLKLKKQAAALLGLPFALTADEVFEEERQAEEKRLEILREAEAQAAALSQAREERLACAREVGADKYLAKRDTIATILKRPQLRVGVRDGISCSGIPVTQDEWPMLPNGTPVVLVKSFDATTGASREPSEYFLVAKSGGGRPSKLRPRLVISYKENGGRKVDMYKPPKPVAKITTVVVQDGDMERTVIVFETMDDIRQAQQGGLNNHTLVARRQGSSAKEGKVEVFRIDSSGISPYKHLPVAPET